MADHPELKPLRIFLSYAHADVAAARKVYRYLRGKGFEVWFDKEKLLPGQDWRLEIQEGLNNSDVVIVCLSRTSVSKEGFFQREFKFALDRALNMPDRRIFLMPVRLNNCNPPTQLSRYHWVDLFEPEGAQQLVRGLNHCAEQLGRTQVEEESRPSSAQESEKIIVEGNAHAQVGKESRSSSAQGLEKIIVEGNARGNIIIIGDRNVIRTGDDKEKQQDHSIDEKTEKQTEQTLNAEQERLAREKADAEKKLQTESEKRLREKAQEEQRASKVKILALLFLSILVLAFVGYFMFWSLPPISVSTPTLTSTHAIVDTKTPIIVLTSTPTKTLPTATSTFLPPTDIPLTPTPFLTPTLAAGDVMVFPKDKMRLHYVPAGPFIMGSSLGGSNERPAHSVDLSAFWIDETEVTNRMYALCVTEKKCNLPYNLSSLTRTSYYGNPQYENFPVVHVFWKDAKTYCQWAGRDLPSEAQWEKAASWKPSSFGEGQDEGEAMTYPWGNDMPNASLLNYSRYLGDTSEVGSYPSGASPYGALDMAGNVWEWVNDFYDPDYYKNSPPFDPPGPAFGDAYGLRGGSWNSAKGSVRASYRGNGSTGHINFDTGFRCALPAP